MVHVIDGVDVELVGVDGVSDDVLVQEKHPRPVRPRPSPQIHPPPTLVQFDTQQVVEFAESLGQDHHVLGGDVERRTRGRSACPRGSSRWNGHYHLQILIFDFDF